MTKRIRCNICNRFISHLDLLKGWAIHRLITPESDYSVEEFETLCRRHAHERISG